jgi:uncharacterized protein YjiS (DUF1127 family)
MVNRTACLTAPSGVSTSTERLSVVGKVARFSAGLCRRWLLERRIWQAVRELEQLDDRALKDIGLLRGTIESQVRTALGKPK